MDDVTPERAAIRILPGSHRTLGEHWEAMLAKHRHGQSLPVPRSGQHGDYEGDYDQVDFAGQQPFPVSARRGQALVFSQGLMHSAWHNELPLPRKSFNTSWVAEGVSIGGMQYDVARFGSGHAQTPRDYRIAGLRQAFPQLRARLPVDRRHIVMDSLQLEASVAAWRERWPPSLQGRFRL